MRKSLTGLIKYIIAFGIAGFLIWLSLHALSHQDKLDIKAALLRANYLLVLPVFILLLLSHWFRCLRWKQIIEPLGYKTPVFVLLCGLLIGYTTNQLIPRAGEIVRCTVIAQQQKIPVAKLIGTVIIERSLDLFCLALLSITAFFIEYKYINTYATDMLHSLKSYLQNVIHSPYFIIALMFVFIISFIIYIIVKRNSKWSSFFSTIFKNIWEGLSSIKNVQNKFLFIIYTVMIWVAYIGVTWIGCFAMKETAHLKLNSAVILLVFGSLGIIIAPGGLGAYPYTIQKILVFYGINKNISIAFGWLLWLIQFLFTIIFGLLAYIVINERNKKHAKHSVNSG